MLALLLLHPLSLWVRPRLPQQAQREFPWVGEIDKTQLSMCRRSKQYRPDQSAMGLKERVEKDELLCVRLGVV